MSTDPGTGEAAPAFEPFGGDAPCAVKLEAFEGPLDLLLHLIRQNEVDIHDIPVALIAEQYLEYLEVMRELNIDVAGEYLVMAATLAWIKSRMLLPPEPGEEEGEEGPDPRAELVARLIEYQRFREAAQELDERWRLGRDVFAARAPEPERVPESEREIEVGLFELIEAFRQIWKRAREVHAHDVEVETVTVRERMIAVMKAIEGTGSLEFGRLFEPASLPGAPSRPMVVATFLAILELSRLAAIRVYQGLDADGAPSGPIRLRVASSPETGTWAERISELM